MKSIWRRGALTLAAVLALACETPAGAQSYKYEALHQFAGAPSDGALPFSGVIRGSGGNLYGTTASGGASDAGTVYKLSATGQITLLYSFTGGVDGAGPRAVLVPDSDGNLYGTTVLGGGANYGVVFKLSSAGTETVLHSFTGGTDGEYPQAGVVRDPQGNLYGTTSNGGSSGWGIVFKVDTAGTETILHSFTGGADGGSPESGLIWDPQGNLYGTTAGGGASETGVVFKMDTNGVETVLYTFLEPPNAVTPWAGLARDSQGNLYGTTAGGGTLNGGTVFKLDTAGIETVLCSFTGHNGDLPYAAPILDSAGNLYGTTYEGGVISAGQRRGVVYELTAAGAETVLHYLTGSASGAYPWAGLIRDSQGSLYGAAEQGGTSNMGVVFKLTPE